MPRVPERTNGVKTSRLTDKQLAFVQGYANHRNGKKAAIDAGYSKKSAAAQAVKLLSKPLIKAALGKLQRESREQFEIERNEILWHLWACATRDPIEYVDEEGKIIDEVDSLPEKARAAVESIRQKVIRRTTLKDGTTEEVIETEVKLVSKATALNMAMQHKGLFAAEKHEHSHININWEDLFEPTDLETFQDPIDTQFKQLESGA